VLVVVLVVVLVLERVRVRVCAVLLVVVVLLVAQVAQVAFGLTWLTATASGLAFNVWAELSRLAPPLPPTCCSLVS